MLASCVAIASLFVVAAASCDSGSNVVGGPSVDGDSGTPRDGGGSSDAIASSCVPGDVSTFTGGDYHPPVGAYQGLCDSDALAAYVDCRQNANPVSCAALATVDGAKCLSCIETKPIAAHWGPVLLDATGANATANFPGCLALAYGEGQSTTGCAATTQKSINCETLACAANCTSANGVTPKTDLAQCENAALVGGCKSFAAAATLACTEDGGTTDAGSAEDQCNRQTGQDGGVTEDELAYIARLAKYFCGNAPSAFDAGAVGDGG